MVKREYQEIDVEDNTDSLTPITSIKKEVVQNKLVAISSANTTPKKKARSQSSKSTDGGEGPDTPKSKSPAKSVSPLYLKFDYKMERADDSDGPHPKMRS
jgi:hypothetical protein